MEQCVFDLYRPLARDAQVPHAQGELYIVLRGSGTLSKAGIVRPFKQGDVLFVEARGSHRKCNWSSRLNGDRPSCYYPPDERDLLFYVEADGLLGRASRRDSRTAAWCTQVEDSESIDKLFGAYPHRADEGKP